MGPLSQNNNVMEIKDTQAIYEFLGNLSWFGSIAFFILLAIIIAFITLNISEKIFDSKSKRLKRNTTFLVILTVIICGIIIKNEANNSKEQLRYANAIKSYLLEFKQRYKSLKGLANDIVLSSEDVLCKGDVGCIQRRIKRIKEIVEEHPDEFIITPVNDVWEQQLQYNVEGLELIEEKATRVIDSSVAIMVPFYENKIIHYMLQNKIDTLSYIEILDKIDGRCYDKVVDMVVLNSKGLLIPMNKENPTLFLDKKLIKTPSSDKRKIETY